MNAKRKTLDTKTDPLEWLEEIPPTKEVLEDIKKLDPIDWDADPEFMADCLKGGIVEEILDAMREEDLTKSGLAAKLGKSRQYITRVLNETANLTINSLAEMACALNRKIEILFVEKGSRVFVEDDYASATASGYSASRAGYDIETAPDFSDLKVAEQRSGYETSEDEIDGKKLFFAA